MASTSYALDRSQVFQASGRYAKGLDGEDPKDPRPAIRRLIESFSAIQAFHRKITAGDGQIVGVERSRLLELVDAEILAAVALVRKCSASDAVDLSAEEGGHGRMLFDFDDDGWSLKGDMPLRLSAFRGTLPDFYRDEFCPPLRSFLEEYRTAAADGTVSPQEAATLGPRLRDILLVSLKLYFLLFYMRING